MIRQDVRGGDTSTLMRSVLVTRAHPVFGMGARPENGMGVHVRCMVSMHAIQAYPSWRHVMGLWVFVILAGPDWLLRLSGLLWSTIFAQKRGFRDPGGERDTKDNVLRHTHAEVLPLLGHGVQSHAKVSAPR